MGTPEQHRPRAGDIVHSPRDEIKRRRTDGRPLLLFKASNRGRIEAVADVVVTAL